MNVYWSVSYDKPLSHCYVEWMQFSAWVLEVLQRMNERIVFLLIGAEAKKLRGCIHNHNPVFTDYHPAASRYKRYEKLYDSPTLGKCINSLNQPIRLLL